MAPDPLKSRGASVDTGSPVSSALQKQVPVLNLTSVANERRNRQLFRGTRNRPQLQAGLVWQAVGLALVHFLGRPDQVLPGVLATARAGHDVVEATLIRAQSFGRFFGTLA